MSVRPHQIWTCFVGLILISCFSANQASACRCAPSTIEEQINFVDIIFTGTVLPGGKTLEKIRMMSEEAERSWSWYGRTKVRFEIERVWKGEVSGEPNVYTGVGGGDCGFHFEEEKTYLVFGYLRTPEVRATQDFGTVEADDAVEPTQIWAHICSSTMELSNNE